MDFISIRCGLFFAMRVESLVNHEFIVKLFVLFIVFITSFSVHARIIGSRQTTWKVNCAFDNGRQVNWSGEKWDTGSYERGGTNAYDAYYKEPRYPAKGHNVGKTLDQILALYLKDYGTAYQGDVMKIGCTAVVSVVTAPGLL